MRRNAVLHNICASIRTKIQKSKEDFVFKSLSKVFLILSISLIGKLSLAEENGLPLHGFADIFGGSTSVDAPVKQKLNGFNLGTVDFYLNPEFSGGAKALIELAFEPDGSNGAIGPDVERLQVGYSLTDKMTVWVGRFHTPYGYWNTAFHHGGQLQTSIYRPRFIDFEDKGGIMPAHTMGMWLRGSADVGASAKFVYDLYSGNGPRIYKDDHLDPNLLRADREGSMVGGNLALKFTEGSMDGLIVGLHAFKSPVNTVSTDAYTDGSTAPANRTDVSMNGGYVVVDNSSFQLDAEFYNFANNNKDVTTGNSTGTYNSSAYFVMAGIPVHQKYLPFVRYESTKFDSKDNYFQDQANGKTNYHRSSVGLRYELEEKAALKIELMNTELPDVTTANKWTTFAAQYAIRF